MEAALAIALAVAPFRWLAVVGWLAGPPRCSARSRSRLKSMRPSAMNLRNKARMGSMMRPRS
jgi:hypothetical protein